MPLLLLLHDCYYYTTPTTTTTTTSLLLLPLQGHPKKDFHLLLVRCSAKARPTTKWSKKQLPGAARSRQGQVVKMNNKVCFEYAPKGSCQGPPGLGPSGQNEQLNKVSVKAAPKSSCRRGARSRQG